VTEVVVDPYGRKKMQQLKAKAYVAAQSYVDSLRFWWERENSCGKFWNHSVRTGGTHVTDDVAKAENVKQQQRRQ